MVEQMTECGSNLRVKVAENVRVRTQARATAEQLIMLVLLCAFWGLIALVALGTFQ